MSRPRYTNLLALTSFRFASQSQQLDTGEMIIYRPDYFELLVEKTVDIVDWVNHMIIWYDIVS